jgi:hypothetical protein
MASTMKLAAFSLALGLVLAPAARGEDPKPAAPHKLVGTWKMVSAKYGGQEFKSPEGTTTLKHVTPAHFMWASYDKDGVVARTAGGTYTITGETYEETPAYGMSSDFDIIKGKAQTFKWKVDGNKWHHNGQLSNGLTIEEVWERVEGK